MFKITLLFESNEKGIYTKEEETATNEFWVKTKKERMIKRWLKNLCPYIDIDTLMCSLHIKHQDQDDYELIIEIIKSQLEIFNKIDGGCRKFDITVEEIQNI
jgi:hypothetical protein